MSIFGLMVFRVLHHAYKSDTVSQSRLPPLPPPPRYFLLRKASRPQLLQEILDVRKRMRGCPTSGRVTIVITDIENYSGLMKANSEVAIKALIIHNNLIEKAKFQVWTSMDRLMLLDASASLLMCCCLCPCQNFGYVIEQEGDSFSIAFEDAQDAISFSLQV